MIRSRSGRPCSHTWDREKNLFRRPLFRGASGANHTCICFQRLSSPTPLLDYTEIVHFPGLAIVSAGDFGVRLISRSNLEYTSFNLHHTLNIMLPVISDPSVARLVE